MDDTTPDAGEEYGTDKRPEASARWLELIEDAEKEAQFYREKCDSIDKLYADLEALSSQAGDREFQIFWANLEVLKPSVYSRPPVPVVQPRFRDRRELPRRTSEVLERSLVSGFEADDVHATLICARDDLVVAARGVVWLRYDAQQTPEGGISERVVTDHLDRDDFLHDPARKWKEVGWVSRRSWLNRKDGLERFGDIWLDAEFKDKETDKPGDSGIEKKAGVWEIWHKAKGIVVWVTPGVEDVLDAQEPWLDLEGFFPCPRPAYGTLQRRTLTPVPDFVYYRDQVEEINELTARISSLSESLRMKGFYAGGAEDVASAVERIMEDQDNRSILVPVANFAALGGASLKDAIVWLPVSEVAQVIGELINLRRQLIEDVYQITGISDIMRGSTQASETLGAQQLKSQYGSVRIRERQNEMIRLARDVTRMSAEIMAENFQPDTLLSMAQVDDLPTSGDIQQQIARIVQQAQQATQNPELMQQAQENPEAAEQLIQQAQEQVQTLQNTVTLDAVMELLRSQRTRPFVLDIETDSTIQPDEDAEKQRRTEFVAAFGGLLQQAGPMVQQAPDLMGPVVAGVMQFAASAYRVDRTLDGILDEFAEKLKEMPAPQAQEGPSPEQVKAQMDAQRAQAEAEAKQGEMQIKMAEVQAKIDDMQQQATIRQETAVVEIEKTRAEIDKINAEILLMGSRPSPQEETVDGP